MIKINKILVADDHELVIKGICSILNERFSVNDITVFTNPEKILSEVEKQSFDLYILDLEFQEMLGFELISQIRKIQHNAKIIVVTMHDEIWNVKHLLALNVNGIVLKKSSGDYLEEAINTVMDNKQFLCPKFLELKNRNSAYIRNIKKENSRPSQSELSVLKYVAKGYSSKEIAKILNVTENTIEAHRKNLFLKLDARNVAHLVSIAIRRHLIE